MSTSSLSLLVTGASGHLGRRVVQELVQAGHQVHATDQRPANGLDCRFTIADLRDHEQVNPLLADVDAVVHLGNHPTLIHPQRTFNDNVAINLNVFQGAAEVGVPRIVFASSLQLIGGHPDHRTVTHLPPLPAYPINGDTPPTPTNTYALSKSVSEVMLRYYVERCGLSAVAIRYPLLLGTGVPDWALDPEVDETVVREGFSVLSLPDAAGLVAAILAHPRPGFRIYAPGFSARCTDKTNADRRREYYLHLPVNDEELIHDPRITAETGWTPTRPTSYP